MNNKVENSNPISPNAVFFNIESDSSDYSDTDESEDDMLTDDDLLCMTEKEKLETKYLAIFQNNSDEFNEQVISVENQEELKNWNCQ